MGGVDNHCITLHQPWASLLVHGIKRIEGRSWRCPMRGRLWIHAASKVPDDATIKAMEEFYRQVYAVDGVTEIVFPEHYPVSVLLGCVEVVGCLHKEELENWEEVSSGVRLEAQTEFCWLCEDPQKLVVPLEMRGRQGVYNLQKKILEVAPRALRKIQGPAPVTFPHLDSDPYSIKPGCLQRVQNATGKSPVNISSAELDSSIAGAQMAALQFRRQDNQVDQHWPSSSGQSSSSSVDVNRRRSSGRSTSSFLDRLSSPGPADFETCFQFGQNTLPDSNMDKRERVRTLPGDSGKVVSSLNHNDGRNSGSMPVNNGSLRASFSRAPCRTRTFAQALGALSLNGSR